MKKLFSNLGTIICYWDSALALSPKLDFLFLDLTLRDIGLGGDGDLKFYKSCHLFNCVRESVLCMHVIKKR